MKRSAANSTRSTLKWMGLLGVAILVFQLAPVRDKYKNNSRIENSLRPGTGPHAALPASKRKEKRIAFAEERTLVQRRDGWRPETNLSLELNSTVPRNALYRAGTADEETVENLEPKVLMAMTIGARMDVVEALTQADDLDRARQVLSQVLVSDRNAEIRIAALEALDEIDEVPFGTLAEVASNDSDPLVRSSALEMIGDLRVKDAQVFQLLGRVAKRDSNQDVRQLATSLLSLMIRGSS